MTYVARVLLRSPRAEPLMQERLVDIGYFNAGKELPQRGDYITLFGDDYYVNGKLWHDDETWSLIVIDTDVRFVVQRAAKGL